MMCPRHENPHKFEYPDDRLLQIRGIVRNDDLRNPQDKDGDNGPGLMVLECGRTTGLTMGRANNIFSYTRKYCDDNVEDISMELAGVSTDNKAFLAPRDSGSVVVDGSGRIITGGARTDVSYVTPTEFISNGWRPANFTSPTPVSPSPPPTTLRRTHPTSCSPPASIPVVSSKTLCKY